MAHTVKILPKRILCVKAVCDKVVWLVGFPNFTIKSNVVKGEGTRLTHSNI